MPSCRTSTCQKALLTILSQGDSPSSSIACKHVWVMLLFLEIHSTLNLFPICSLEEDCPQFSSPSPSQQRETCNLFNDNINQNVEFQTFEGGSEKKVESQQKWLNCDHKWRFFFRLCLTTEKTIVVFYRWCRSATVTRNVYTTLCNIKLSGNTWHYYSSSTDTCRHTTSK